MSDIECCCAQKHTPRDPELKKQLINRLNRISGQIQGIARMIESERYCGDVLVQVAAAEKALQNFGYLVLRDHMNSCLVEKLAAGDGDIIDETVDLIKQLK